MIAPHVATTGRGHVIRDHDDDEKELQVIRKQGGRVWRGRRERGRKGESGFEPWAASSSSACARPGREGGGEGGRKRATESERHISGVIQSEIDGRSEYKFHS
eukprot:3732399-Rhodomonas_salina.1